MLQHTHRHRYIRLNAWSNVRTVAAELLKEHVYSSETKQCMKTEIKITDLGISEINIEVLRSFLSVESLPIGLQAISL